MKLLAPIAAIIAAASAGRIYNVPAVENYGSTAEAYQSGLEQQQHGLYSSQPSHSGHETINHRPEAEKHAKILGFHNENDGHHYQYAYETENGIKAEEAGETNEHGTSAHGAYSYKGDDGQIYTITYTADENGFRPIGAHIPTPPPVPEQILKSLEQNAHDEASGIFDDGKYREHPELGHQNQQFESGHQSTGFQSSGYSGANLAYHAHAPTIHSTPKVVHQAPIRTSSASHHSSGHSGSSYFTPSAPSTNSHSGSQTSLGHGSSLGQQFSSNHISNLGHQSSSYPTLSHQSLGHQSLGHQGSSYQSLDHQSSSYPTLSHGSNLGNQMILVRHLAQSGSNYGHQTPIIHGSNFQSGFHASSGPSIASFSHSAPSGFSIPSSQGISGHSGLSYLPPVIHGHGYSYNSH